MKLKSSEITSESSYLSRREFIAGAGATLAGAVILSGCGEKAPDQPNPRPGKTKKSEDELGDSLTSFAAVTHYNNFFEFTTDKEDVAALSVGFKTKPWTIKVGGLVRKPKTFDIDALIRKFGAQERVYRLRCVEAWSMVIPWLGFPLAKLLNEVEPTSKAAYVRFTSLLDPKEMPGQNNTSYYWPYIEGLRLDEAMNNLTLLSHGLYGRGLLPQNGAPLRLVVPWKYGFKSAKSIVKIDLVEKMPISLWMRAAPDQYGFYANVNPKVAHVRWSQSTERRIGELSRRKTLLFNGYGEEVAGLYSGKPI
ncbi:MAG TPA: protein-methionine-sulfoxide reductase catalytic subunit MsrP, partial [Actinobacteria bacterium]|nr:protein-methionine-sulfoxide reductase catalytic subunit MsrP [Actinomycetota bacterium]